jgi:hypothetical protein
LEGKEPLLNSNFLVTGAQWVREKQYRNKLITPAIKKKIKIVEKK